MPYNSWIKCTSAGNAHADASYPDAEPDADPDAILIWIQIMLMLILIYVSE